MEEVCIGDGRTSSFPYVNGPIGIYDKTNIQHLTNMVNDAIRYEQCAHQREESEDISMDTDED